MTSKNPDRVLGPGASGDVESPEGESGLQPGLAEAPESKTKNDDAKKES